MALEIIIIKAPGSVTVSEKSHTFVGSGGTIGRGESNQLVLEDADRFLSSQHCEIICNEDHNYIVDLSTNGTFLNGSPEPLGKGVKAVLKDGDTFELGDYTLQVKCSASLGAPPVSPFDGDKSPFGSPDTTDAFSSSSPFGEADDVFATPPEPFGLSQNGFPGENIPGGEFDFSGEEVNADPLAALDFIEQPAQPAFGEPYADLGSVAPSHERKGSYADGASALTSAVSWPESSGQNLIPEEWEDELGFSSTPSTANPAVGPSSDVPFSPEPAASAAEFLQSSTPAMPEPGAGSVSTGMAYAAASVDVQPESYSRQQPAPKPAPPITPMPAPGSQAKAAPPTGSSGGLLEAMGLDPQKLSPDQVAEINQEVGLLMREVVGGMMQVLRSRSSIKNEFRMNVTTIQPVENNPLKFSADVDEALDNMFVRRSGAYKRPIDAVREGFQEIGEHQVAMIAGIRHGFEQMMTRFDPSTLEPHFDRQGGALPGMKKAKYWSQYNDHYKSFIDNMEHSFQHLFGSDFVHAYEDQLRRLKMARNKNN